MKRLVMVLGVLIPCVGCTVVNQDEGYNTYQAPYRDYGHNHSHGHDQSQPYYYTPRPNYQDNEIDVPASPPIPEYRAPGYGPSNIHGHDEQGFNNGNRHGHG